MKLYKNLLLFGGLFHIGIGVFHLFFWHIFQWEKELSLLTHDNSCIMQILNVCLIFVFFIFAYISLYHCNELITTKLGKTILVSISLFWFLRAIAAVMFSCSDLFDLLALLIGIIYILPLRFKTSL